MKNLAVSILVLGMMEPAFAGRPRVMDASRDKNKIYSLNVNELEVVPYSVNGNEVLDVYAKVFYSNSDCVSKQENLQTYSTTNGDGSELKVSLFERDLVPCAAVYQPVIVKVKVVDGSNIYPPNGTLRSITVNEATWTLDTNKKI